MAHYKPGLHKDVEKIFNGVWDTKLDNIQEYVGSTGLSADVKVEPLILEPRSREDVSLPEPEVTETPRRDLILRLMPPQKRHESKRLKLISRYLLAIK
jgi:hypothetical protein